MQPRRVFAWGVLGLTVVAVATAAPPDRYRLANGLRVITQRSAGAHDIALVVLFDIGEDHDPPGRCGLAHLTEHLYVTAAAGGTPARTVADLVARYPKGWNAQTGTDYTVIATVFPAEDLDAELADAAARLGALRPAFADLQREVPRVLEELDNMYAAMPGLAVLNLGRMHARPLPDGHRKGGVPEQVRDLRLEHVAEWWGRYYKPSNATLIAAGVSEPEAFRAAVERHFGGIAAGEQPPPARTALRATPRDAVVHVATAVPGQVGVVLPMPQPTEPDYAAALVLATRLFGRVQVMFSPLDDPTVMGVITPLHEGLSGEQALQQLRAQIHDMATAPLVPSDRLAVINGLGGFMGLTETSPMALAFNPYGVAFSLGRRAQMGVDGTALARRLDALTPEAYRAAIDRLLPQATGTAVLPAPAQP